jgi:hypothetical protein
MASPFPGMNPYLEAPELWAEFHSRMIVAIADALDELLSRQYRVAVEKRVYLSQDEEQLLIGIPDVAVIRNQAETIVPRSNAQSVAVVEPLTVELPTLEEVQERYLEIREGSTGTVITVIELLSPKNKRSGEGRNAYLQKRQEILKSATHLVEIDLLRAGEPMPVKTIAQLSYRILISRSAERPQAQLYGFNLRQSIPVIPIPLQSDVAEPLLDLFPLLNQVYDRARFELGIDYSAMPKPGVSTEDWDWIQKLAVGIQ